MSKPKKDPRDMDNDELKGRYFKLKTRCDWINKWMPRLCAGVGAAVVLAGGRHAPRGRGRRRDGLCLRRQRGLPAAHLHLHGPRRLRR